MSDDLGAGETGLETGGAPAEGSAPSDSGAAPAAQASNTGTIAGGNISDAPAAVPADWPEDWRVKLAGEDKSYLKTLDRFNSPADLAKAYRDAQQRLSSGQLRAVLPDNPTAEELAAWRQQNGVPEAPDKYDVQLGDGFVWGDADKPLLDDFTKYAHDSNMPADQVKKVLGWYARLQEQNLAKMEEADERFHQESEDRLRAEWGAEFRANTNAIGNALDAHAQTEVKEAFLQARLPNGRRLADDPGVLRMLASLAREANPTHTVAPSTGFGSMEDELSILQKKVGTKEYWSDPKMQARYLELLEAKQRSESRGRAA